MLFEFQDLPRDAKTTTPRNVVTGTSISFSLFLYCRWLPWLLLPMVVLPLLVYIKHLGIYETQKASRPLVVN